MLEESERDAQLRAMVPSGNGRDNLVALQHGLTRELRADGLRLALRGLHDGVLRLLLCGVSSGVHFRAQVYLFLLVLPGHLRDAHDDSRHPNARIKSA